MTQERAHGLRKSRETRTFSASNVAVRSESDGLTLTGYASTFNQPYNMGWYSETILPGAFKKTLTESPDVRLLINHDGLPLARTGSGTLRLSEDSTGLHVEASLDPNDPDVQSIAPKMARGDLNQMSFAFRVIRDAWNDDYSQRNISEVSFNGCGADVSVVTYPANPNAMASMRSVAGLSAAMAWMSAICGELREGKVISQANLDRLQKVLDALAAADDNLDAAESALAEVLGEPNPDDDAVTEPDEALSADDETDAARSLSTYKARAEALRLRARR